MNIVINADKLTIVTGQQQVIAENVKNVNINFATEYYDSNNNVHVGDVIKYVGVDGDWGNNEVLYYNGDILVIYKIEENAIPKEHEHSNILRRYLCRKIKSEEKHQLYRTIELYEYKMEVNKYSSILKDWKIISL